MHIFFESSFRKMKRLILYYLYFVKDISKEFGFIDTPENIGYS